MALTGDCYSCQCPPHRVVFRYYIKGVHMEDSELVFELCKTDG